MNDDADLLPILGPALNLSPCQAAIVERLYRAGNRWVSVYKLNDDTAAASASYDHAAEPRTKNCVRVHIHYLRKKLGAEFIIGHVGYGYTLGASGVMTCKRILHEVA